MQRKNSFVKIYVTCYFVVKKPSDPGQLASRFNENDFPAIGKFMKFFWTLNIFKFRNGT